MTLLIGLVAAGPGAVAGTSGEVAASRHGADAARASTLPAPRALTATLQDSSVSLTWRRVKGAKKYGVVVYPGGVPGPERIRWAKAGRHHRSIPFESLPTRGRGGFRMQVFGYSKSMGRSAYTSIKIAEFKDKAVRRRHFTEDDDSSLKSAVRVVRNCGRDGLSVAVGTAVVGAPFVAFSVPIPGVGQVTAGGLAAVAGVAGGGATVACFASNLLGGG